MVRSGKKTAQKRSNALSGYVPLEEEEHFTFAQFLNLNGLLWLHPFNEGKIPIQYRLKQIKLGLKKGAPDFFIFHSPSHVHKCGIAVELKRKSKSKSKISPEQIFWIQQLQRLNWECKICFGADQAIDYVKNLLGIP